MQRHAHPVRPPPARSAAAAKPAARIQTPRLSPWQEGAMRHAIQLRAARSAASVTTVPAESGPSDPLRAGAEREAQGMDRASSHGVIQAKLRILGTILEDGKQLKDKPVPPRLLAYHQSQSIYQVRDDWSTDFKDPIHLIAPDKVYLLGEKHDASKWAEQTRHWTVIDKMTEARKSFPGIVTEKLDPQDQPLESMHAFLLHTVLYTKSQMRALKANKDAVPPATIVDDILWGIGQILATKVGYGRLTKAILADKSAKPYEAETIFLESLNKKHLNSAEITKSLATKLKADVATKNPNAEVLARIKDLKKLVVGQAGALATLATDVMAVIGVAADSVKGKAISAEAKSKVAVAPAASAAMSVREGAMAANINAAKPPLLVGVGDGHVESLGGLVPKSVKVRAGDTLAKHTLV
jgi:hypothetical protein